MGVGGRGEPGAGRGAGPWHVTRDPSAPGRPGRWEGWPFQATPQANAEEKVLSQERRLSFLGSLPRAYGKALDVPVMGRPARRGEVQSPRTACMMLL